MSASLLTAQNVSRAQARSCSNEPSGFTCGRSSLCLAGAGILQILKLGGVFVAKMFMGSETNNFKVYLRSRFKKVSSAKPRYDARIHELVQPDRDSTSSRTWMYLLTKREVSFLAWALADVGLLSPPQLGCESKDAAFLGPYLHVFGRRTLVSKCRHSLGELGMRCRGSLLT